MTALTNSQVRSVQLLIESCLREAYTEERLQKEAGNKKEEEKAQKKIRLLRNGFLSEESGILRISTTQNVFMPEPLSFVELTSYNAWFLMHPQKVAGIESETTSRDFPVRVKGTLADVIRVLKQGIAEKQQQNAQKKSSQQSSQEREKENGSSSTIILALAAKAKLKKFKLRQSLDKNRK